MVRNPRETWPNLGAKPAVAGPNQRQLWLRKGYRTQPSSPPSFSWSAFIAVRKGLGIGRVLEMRIRTPDGTVMAWGDAYERYGDVMDPGLPGYAGGFDQVYIINPGALYPIVEARMSVIFGAIGLLGIVVSVAGVILLLVGN